MGGGDEVPWSENDAELVCKAQAAHRAAMRLAFLKGQHPRSAASPLPPHSWHGSVLGFGKPSLNFRDSVSERQHLLCGCYSP